MREFLKHQTGLQAGRFFLWFPVALGLGIGLYFSLTFEPSTPQYLVVLGIGCLAAYPALKSSIRWPGLWLATLCLGVCLAGLHAHLAAAPKLKYRFYGPVEGRIVSVDRSARERPRILLDQVRLGRLPPATTPERVRISLHFDGDFLPLQPGRRVVLTAHLSPPSRPAEPGGFDFQRHAWFEGLGAVGYSRTPVLEIAPRDLSGLSLRLQALRQDLAEAIRLRVGGAEGAFAAAILVGDRTGIQNADVEALRRANLAHLLAISGLHMGLLTGFVFVSVQIALAALPRQSLYWPVRRIAALAAMLAALFYLGISGAGIATERAFLMALILFVAVFLDRRAITLHAVAAAATLILILRPHSLIEAGFQMSFAATTGLVAVFAAMRDLPWMRAGKRRGRLLNWFFSLAMSSAIAGLATAPFSAFHFNQMSQYGLLANILSVPAMGLVIMPFAVLASLVAPLGLDGPFWLIVAAGIRWILGVAHWVAGFENAARAIVKPENAVFVILVLALVFLILWRGMLRFLAVPVGAFALVAWSATQRPDILISEDGRLIGVLHEAERTLSKARGHGFAAGSWLENDGDPADQAEAAQRQMPPGIVGVDLSKSGKARCLDAEVTLAPRRTAQSDDCLLLDQSHFRREGATAIWRRETGGLHLRTSRGVRGDRLWSHRPQ